MTQILYVNEGVVVSVSEEGYQVRVKDPSNKNALDRALQKCGLTLEEVEVENE